MLKRVAFLLALVASVPAGIAAASAAGLGGAAEPPSPKVTPIPGSDRNEGRAGDNRGGPPWSVLVYETEEGQTCRAVGQVVDGKVGHRSPDGDFTPYPMAEGADCTDASGFPDSEPFGAHMTVVPRGGGHSTTIVWGTTRDDVAEMAVDGPGAARRLPLSERNAFISVYNGAGTDIEFIATMDDGTTRRAVHSPPPTPTAEQRRAAQEAADRHEHPDE